MRNPVCIRDVWTRVICFKPESFEPGLFQSWFSNISWEKKNLWCQWADFTILSIITPLCMSRLMMCDLCITVDQKLLHSKSSSSSFMFLWSSVLFINGIFFMFPLLFVLEPTSYCRNSTMPDLCTAVLKFEPWLSDKPGLTGLISTNRTNQGVKKNLIFQHLF